MTHPPAEAVPYVAGALTGVTTLLAQVQPTGMLEGWMQLILQAGLGGIVVLLLLKFFPAMLDRMEIKDKVHEETIRHIVERNEKKDEAWQQIVQSRGICPVNKDNNPNNP